MNLVSNNQVIAIIPARSGSKRIPKKNIRSMCGKPIIAFTIEAAIQSKIFLSVIVSTDSQEIADISQEYGAEVPFIRSKEISDDNTPVSLVTCDTIDKLDNKGEKYKYIAQLLPNCPLRDSTDVISSFSQFIESKAESQISVTRYGWLNPWWAMTKDKNHALTAIFEKQLQQRSQDLPDLFCPTGAIWWIRAETLKRKKTFYCENRTGWEIRWDHAVDIDNEDDWQIAEVIMRQKLGSH